MFRNNPYFHPLAVSLGFFAAIIVITFMYPPPSPGGEKIAFALVGLVVLYFAVHFVKEFKNPNAIPTERAPRFYYVVHVWEHDGLTAICASYDFELWHAGNQRVALVLGTNPRVRVAPRLLAVFTDHPAKANALGAYRTGSMEDYKQLMMGCRAVRSEMFIPPTKESMASHGYVPVNFEAAIRLIEADISLF